MRISHVFLTGFFAIFLASALMAGNASTTAKTVQGKEVVQLKLRDHTVTIKTTKKGTLYTVKDADGKVLVTDLTAEQLQAKNPTLYETLAPAIAKPSDATLDASVRSGASIDASGLGN